MLHINVEKLLGQPQDQPEIQSLPQQPLLPEPPVDAHVPALMSAPLINPNNDGWGPLVSTQPLCSTQGWPGVSPPNPPSKPHISHLQYVAS